MCLYTDTITKWSCNHITTNPVFTNWCPAKLFLGARMPGMEQCPPPSEYTSGNFDQPCARCKTMVRCSAGETPAAMMIGESALARVPPEILRDELGATLKRKRREKARKEEELEAARALVEREERMAAERGRGGEGSRVLVGFGPEPVVVAGREARTKDGKKSKRRRSEGMMAGSSSSASEEESGLLMADFIEVMRQQHRVYEGTNAGGKGRGVLLTGNEIADEMERDLAEVRARRRSQRKRFMSRLETESSDNGAALQHEQMHLQQPEADDDIEGATMTPDGLYSDDEEEDQVSMSYNGLYHETPTGLGITTYHPHSEAEMLYDSFKEPDPVSPVGGARAGEAEAKLRELQAADERRRKREEGEGEVQRDVDALVQRLKNSVVRVFVGGREEGEVGEG